MKQTKVESYRIVSRAQPGTVGNKQALRVYEVMDELNEELKRPATMDEIVKKAEYRKYRYLLVTEPDMEASLRYHLRRFVKKGWAEQS
jgi:2-phosphoglycerate kinase